MESTPASPGLSESSLNKPEISKDKDVKDKKNTKQWVPPIQKLFTDAVETKPDRNIKWPGSETTATDDPKLFGFPERKQTDEATSKPEAKLGDHQDEAGLTTQLVMEAAALDAPKEAFGAGLERLQTFESTERPKPWTEKPLIEVTLPPLSEQGELELPLNATKVHQRLHFAEAKTDDEPSKEPPRQEATPDEAEVVAASVPETEQEQHAPDATGSGNGNFQPPRGPEHAASSPEPEPPNLPPQPKPAETAPWHAQAEAQHQARLFNALEVNQPPAPAATHETRIIERNSDGLALLVGVTDWFGRRRIRKELRRGQKRQDKQIKQLQRRQQSGNRQSQQQLTEQRSINSRLHHELERFSETVTRDKQKRQQFETSHARILEEHRRASPIEAKQQTVPVSAAAEVAPHLPTDHHLESSAWHSIEVDKAGRVVEKPTLAYGQEFQHEQQQETRHKDMRVAATATGQLAVSGSASDAPGQPPMPPTGLHIPPSMVENTIHERPYHKLTTTAQNPWVLILVIIVFFVVVSLLIVH